MIEQEKRIDRDEAIESDCIQQRRGFTPEHNQGRVQLEISDLTGSGRAHNTTRRAGRDHERGEEDLYEEPRLERRREVNDDESALRCRREDDRQHKTSSTSRLILTALRSNSITAE